MGSLLSTPDPSRTATESSWATFPPKAGVVFSGHFYLGGEKFESVARESYIFADSSELQYLNSKPLALPFAVGKPGHISQPLRALINIRKETVRFVKALYETLDGPTQQQYNVEFVFDCLADCTVSLYLFAKESFNGHQLVVEPQNAIHLSPEYARFEKGYNLVFSKSEVIVKPAMYDAESWESRDSVFPIAILCEVTDPSVAGVHQQLLLCTAEKQYDSTFSLKVLKQKQVIDGVVLVLHDMYGISDREVAGLGQPQQEPAKPEEELDDGSGDCVICMVMPRDTLILPCRHLCLCASCADSLRYQASACPICRAPFKALLQLSVLKTATPRRPPDKEIYASVCDLNASTSRVCDESVERVDPPAEEQPDGAAGEEMRMRSVQQKRTQAPAGYTSVPILEFVDEQRQQLATASGGHRRTSARGRSEAWGTPSKSLPAAAAAAASGAASSEAKAIAKAPGRRRKSHSSSRSPRSDESRGSSSSENDWADSESGADDDDDEEAARVVTTKMAEKIATAVGDQPKMSFTMPVTDLTLLVPDGDADRGSCSTSTESANSNQQLINSKSLPAHPACDDNGDDSASGQSDFNDVVIDDEK